MIREHRKISQAPQNQFKQLTLHRLPRALGTQVTTYSSDGDSKLDDDARLLGDTGSSETKTKYQHMMQSKLGNHIDIDSKCLRYGKLQARFNCVQPAIRLGERDATQTNDSNVDLTKVLAYAGSCFILGSIYHYKMRTFRRWFTHNAGLSGGRHIRLYKTSIGASEISEHNRTTNLQFRATLPCSFPPQKYILSCPAFFFFVAATYTTGPWCGRKKKSALRVSKISEHNHTTSLQFMVCAVCA